MEEFMVCVDRIIASSSSSSTSTAAVAPAAACFEVSVNNAEKERVFLSTSATADDHGEKNVKGNEHGDGVVIVLKSQKSENGVVRECRICQEEDEEQDMETPCACNGTLKFAHRNCIQRWCNKKGDISCEICNQVFSPNYTLPPTQRNPDVVAIEIRQAWGANINLQDPHFLAFAAAQHQFLQPDYEDYTIARSGPLAYFRLVVIASMLLLIIRQTLMVTRDFAMVQESSIFFRIQILLLQLGGFLIPCYVMARSWYIVQCRRRRQV